MAHKINIYTGSEWANILKDFNIEITDANGLFIGNDLETVLDELHLSNAVADTVDPTVTDDGYKLGALWLNTTSDYVFICVDNTSSNAIWRDLGAIGYKLVSPDGLTEALNVDNDGKITLLNGTGIDEFSTDTTMASATDDSVPTTLAAKTYTDDVTKTFEQIIDSPLDGSTYSTLSDLMNTTHSSGRISGGDIIDNLDGLTVTVTAGTGLIRATNDVIGNVHFFNWPEDTNISITSHITNWIYVDYNAGTPIVKVTTNRTGVINSNSNFIIGRVYTETGAGHVHSHNAGQDLPDIRHKIFRYIHDTKGAEYASGLLVSETGVLNVGVTAGTFYTTLIRNVTPAIDTSGADTFVYWFQDGVGGYSNSVGESSIDNAQYDDGTGVLATLNNNYHNVHWVYITLDGTLHIQYGQGQYTSVALAEEEGRPTPPSLLNDFAIFTARIITKEGVDSFTNVVSAFITAIELGSINEHNDLAGLQGGTAGEYYHLTATEATKLTNIETEATADQTAQEILDLLLTVDGVTSGLDADLLDGQHASYYALATHSHTDTYTHSQTVSASDTWSVGHILNQRIAQVMCTDISYDRIEPIGISFDDVNNCTITFSVPVSGYAQISK